MWVRSIVKGSIPRTADERFDSATGRSTGIVVWLSSDCRNWRCNTRRVAFLASVSSRTSGWKQFRPYDTPQVIAGQARGKFRRDFLFPIRPFALDGGRSLRRVTCISFLYLEWNDFGGRRHGAGHPKRGQYRP